MKRRSFARYSGASTLALLAGGPVSASAAILPPPDAGLLKTTLTPFGAERAGNAAGTIPAWTGGLTAIPAGFDWDPTQTLPPDFFASDAMLYRVDASNLAQYASLLSEGLQTLIRKQGFYMKVYPTRRTQALPQWVYDNIALNVGRARPQNGDYRLGFTGAYGGAPFPIPYGDPLQAGAQIMWNSEARWSGPYFHETVCEYTNANGQPVMTNSAHVIYRNDYYLPGGSPTNFDKRFYSVLSDQFAPATDAGDEVVSTDSTNPVTDPQMTWELLPGQGRVRKTPQVEYDTPSAYTDGIVNYDETYGFNGPLDRYDWRLLGKREMLIPYNNNKVFSGAATALHTAKYFDPEYVRWELHRVWVVEATLHPGSRNVLARRMFYIDEDDWTIHVTDAWDGAGNIVRLQYLMNANFPNLPGSIYLDSIAYNLQTLQYVSLGGSFGNPPYNVPWSFGPAPASTFEPQTMAASAAY